jgi:cytochrome c-type biogenesis protein CcmE
VKRKKHIVLGGIIIFGVVGALFTLQVSLTPYVDFKVAEESSRPVQVMGHLLPGGTYDQSTGEYWFQLMDGEGRIMPVRYRGGMANLDHAEQVGAIGIYREGVFQAEQLLIKCPSRYQGE